MAALGATAVPEEAQTIQGLWAAGLWGDRKIDWKVNEPLGVLEGGILGDCPSHKNRAHQSPSSRVLFPFCLVFHSRSDVVTLVEVGLMWPRLCTLPWCLMGLNGTSLNHAISF